MKNFTIEATISITPADMAQTVAETFQSAYGDRGSDETPDEHLARKVEEYILNIFQSRQAEDSAHAVRTQTLSDIAGAATIRKRKDKDAKAPPEEKSASPLRRKSKK